MEEEEGGGQQPVTKSLVILILLKLSMGLADNSNKEIVQKLYMKQVRQNMKLLILLFRSPVFIVAGFVFGSTLSQAQSQVQKGDQGPTQAKRVVASQPSGSLKKIMDSLNETKTVETMGSVLKDFFKTAEDHRQIDMDVKEASKTVKNWNWRYLEDEIAFVVNGKTQFRFKPSDAKKGKFLFNNQEFTMNPSLSYMSHKNQLQNILSKKQGVLETMFINKAQAIAPFVVFALGLAGVGIVAATDKGKVKPELLAYRCAKDSWTETMFNTTYPEIADLRPEKHFQGEKPRDRRRYYRNATYEPQNYKWNKLRNRMMALIANYSGYGVKRWAKSRRRLFSDVEGCMKKKMSTRRGHWGLKEEYARAHCQGAWDVYQKCLEKAKADQARAEAEAARAEAGTGTPSGNSGNNDGASDNTFGDVVPESTK